MEEIFEIETKSKKETKPKKEKKEISSERLEKLKAQLAKGRQTMKDKRTASKKPTEEIAKPVETKQEIAKPVESKDNLELKQMRLELQELKLQMNKKTVVKEVVKPVVKNIIKPIPSKPVDIPQRVSYNVFKKAIW